MIKDEGSLLEWIQNWYNQYYDGDWEHDEKFIIENIDNPGWLVSINLVGTHCEDKTFEGLKIDNSERDWYHCFIREGKFKGAGGPFNLEDILRIFKKWAVQCQNESGSH